MAILSVSTSNRLGFVLLGATNTVIYTTMLAAAFDLLSKSATSVDNNSSTLDNLKLPKSSLAIDAHKKPYCNAHSTSTILLANTLPSLATKIIYPFLLVSVAPYYKASATAIIAAIAFITTGLSTNQLFIFIGVICGSFSFGLGESFYLSITPLYGDASMSSWGLGTGLAAFFSSFAYALMRMALSVEQIMMILLVVPVTMLFSYFRLIKPVAAGASTGKPIEIAGVNGSNNHQEEAIFNPHRLTCIESETPEGSSFRTKLQYLRPLAKYFLPLLLVYFAEYFINQGLSELIYYPEIEYLDHAAQYRWFQVSYQLGVMISRSSLDLIKLKNIWAMSILQFVNAILFLAHTTKLIHLPNFYMVIGLIVYEGLLGGFTYVNAFYRVKQEAPPLWLEFSISAVTTADSLGIVIAGLAALPVHDALCQLYV